MKKPIGFIMLCKGCEGEGVFSSQEMADSYAWYYNKTSYEYSVQPIFEVNDWGIAIEDIGLSDDSDILDQYTSFFKIGEVV